MISLKMFDSSQIDRGLLRIKVKGSIIIYDNFPLSQKSVTSGSNRKCSNKVQLINLKKEVHGHDLSLCSYLIEPIQRMSRYPLLLHRLYEQVNLELNPSASSPG